MDDNAVHNNIFQCNLCARVLRVLCIYCEIEMHLQKFRSVLGAGCAEWKWIGIRNSHNKYIQYYFTCDGVYAYTVMSTVNNRSVSLHISYGALSIIKPKEILLKFCKSEENVSRKMHK